MAQAVNDAALERLADRHAQGGAQGDDFAAGMDAVNFAQRHEQHMVIAEADDFRQRGAVVPGGFDAANFADGRERAFRLDDEADELDDAAVVADDLRLLDAAEQAFEAVGWQMVRCGSSCEQAPFR